VWRALYQALGAIGALPPDVSDRGARANALSTSLFPEGVGFTRLTAEGAWAEAKRRIDRLRNEDLEEELAAVVGADFVAAIRTRTAALANAIGTGDAPMVPPRPTAVKEAIKRFSRAVSFYCRTLVHDYAKDDDEAAARFRAATAPLDEHRATRRERGRSRRGAATSEARRGEVA
jgi:hypothetical protein